MPIRIFEPAYNFIDERLTVFLDDRLGAVIAEVTGPLRLALVLYVVLYGIAILRGAISEPVMDFAVRSIKLALLYLLATTTAYGDFVSEPLFNDLPNALTRAVSGQDAANVGSAFDRFFGYAAWLAEDISRHATPVTPAPYAIALLVVLIGALAAALGFGVVLVAKIALALLVTLGPIFIGCALYDATRRFFFGWLSQAVNYLVLFALMIVIFQLVLALVRDQWGAIQGADPMIGGLIFIALSLLGAIFFLQTPAIAAGVAGGASAGLADFANAAALGASGSGRARGPLESARQSPRGGGSIRPGGA
ncbi:type IV secretion system protein [Brevundimonas nasdae]|uniref:Type IV secretion system protein n=1 Tax=Brevundimonas nasdae TaxID=172043 RepID=A0ABX8TKV9_9CAUL|nr:type IV secretion system protein [Brevundimonas nasdae]QYC11457.1 type IV secretion system protein [Brevundimonas nasdae]QYC14245.1 type IV secretion system protein [Brevundimonas nasdae]